MPSCKGCSIDAGDFGDFRVADVGSPDICMAASNLVSKR